MPFPYEVFGFRSLRRSLRLPEALRGNRAGQDAPNCRRQIVAAAVIAWCLGCGCMRTESSPVATRSSPAEWFVDITDAAGLAFVHDGEPAGTYFMPEIMGAGGALLDFDGDGRLDLLLVNGSWSPGAQTSRMQNRLYRQSPDEKFDDVTALAGMIGTTGYGVGIAVGDVDNDGHSDVYITAFGGDRFWLNNGDGTFCDRTDLLENRNRRWGTAAAFFDYDRDGWLDLYVVNYLDYFPGTQCDEGTGRIDYCGPQSFSGSVGKLYRNLGGIDDRGRIFADLTVEAGLASQSSPGLGVICRDFNDDQRPDVYVANDMSPDLLWLQQGDGSFREEGVQRGVAYNRFGHAEASMGIVSDDFNGDGVFDLFITNLRGETNTLFLGVGGGQFTDGTAGSGLGPASLPYTGFGVVSVDVDFDGDLDLIVVNGRVKRGPSLTGATLGPFWNEYAQPNQIYLNDGQGHFSDISERGGLLTGRLDVARALISGDIDNDGDLDLLLTSCAGPARLFRNEVPRAGTWLTVRAIDRPLNRYAIGAKVTVNAGPHTLCREINPSSGYLSSHDPRLVFGLGDAQRFDGITVRWPDGSCEEFEGGSANRQVLLLRGRGRPDAAVEGP